MAQKLTAATRADLRLQQLHKVVKCNWPQTKEVRPYYNYMDEISFYKGLMFKQICIIIPCSLPPVILQHIDAAHLDNEKCRAWARTAVFWPAIHAAIDVRETLIPQQVPQRPWCTVAADIRNYEGRDLFTISPNIWKWLASHKTSESLIMAMKDISACHGIPEKEALDYMPFNSCKFKTFATDWEMKMVTSSPPYPKSNGLVERNVQAMKRLLNESKHDALFALLELLSRRLPQSFTSLRTKITWWRSTSTLIS